MKKRICLLIPDGVGIRNYLYSDLIPLLKEQGNEIVVWHALADEVIRIAEELHQTNLESVPYTSYADPFLIRLYREASTYARLHLNAKQQKNPTILTNWNTKRNTWAKKLLYPMAEFLGGRLKSQKAISRIENKTKSLRLKSKAFKGYKNKIEQMKIDVLFCTHQRVPQVAAAMLAAQQCGVKTYTSIYSWDNLPKGRLPMRADKYFVWSNYMKKELLDYYWDIDKSDVLVVGTPQFDYYRNDSILQSREDFAVENGLDVNKKWILFSGDDPTTSPKDPLYLKDVADALAERADIQILFRQVPSETTIRYDEILKSHDRIFHIQPKWEQGANWNKFYPRFEDVQMLINLAKHCELVINIGSTMALDFSNYNKAALFINYDQESSLPWTVDVIYQFQHFRTMKNLDPVGWINSREEIAQKVSLALEQPELVGPDRKNWFEFIVFQNPHTTASEMIAREICKQ